MSAAEKKSRRFLTDKKELYKLDHATELMGFPSHKTHILLVTQLMNNM